MRTKQIINITAMVFFIGEIIYAVIFTNVLLAAMAGLLLGIYAMMTFYTWSQAHRPAPRPIITISGHIPFMLHMEAMQYVFRGYFIAKNYHRRKYWLFGKITYYVGLAHRLPERSTGERPANAPQNPLDYLSDEELLEQQNYEELAKRRDRRNNPESTQK